MRMCDIGWAVAVLVCAARADTLDVPGQYTTIQAALDAAAAGDVILVQPGTYAEALVLPAFGLTLRATGGADVTTVDATGLGTSAISVPAAASSFRMLDGFTVTGGAGTALGEVPTGGGILVTGSGEVLLRSCRITGNSVYGGRGGGVCALLDAQVTLQGCEVSGNTALYGAGIAAGDEGQGVADFRVLDCTITGNVSEYGSGGGLWVNGAGRLDGCVVAQNSAPWAGGMLNLAADRWIVEGNRFEGNQGGAYVAHFEESMQLADCTFVGNVGGSITSVPPVLCDVGYVLVSGCIFVGNTGADGAPYSITLNTCTAEGVLTPAVRNCTFVNESVWGPSITPVENCVLWDLPAPPLPYAYLSYCDIEGGWPGTGNLDADPLFKDAAAGDYRLSGGSPCIDAGDPSGVPDADGTPPDIGAIPFSPFEDLGHALAGSAGVAQLAGEGTTIAGDPLTVTLSNAAPGTPSTWVLGATPSFAPLKGGVLVPAADVLLGPLVVQPDGTQQFGAPWPVGVPPGSIAYVQAWWPDAAGPAGFAASNGLAIEAR